MAKIVTAYDEHEELQVACEIVLGNCDRSCKSVPNYFHDSSQLQKPHHNITACLKLRQFHPMSKARFILPKIF
jgi:hypothetical protein